VLKDIDTARLKGFPTLLSSGIINGMEYIIMGKLGPNLKSIIR